MGFGRCSLERPGPGGTQVKAKCKHPDSCTKVALKGGLCIAHGGGTKRKHPDGCEKRAKKGGLCQRHLKAELAAQDSVEKQAQVQQNQQQLEQQGEEEDKCAICLEEFTNKAQLIDYNEDEEEEEACMHQLCFICITSWKSKSCPLCKAPNAIIESESGASLPTRSSATTTTMTEDE